MDFLLSTGAATTRAAGAARRSGAQADVRLVSCRVGGRGWRRRWRAACCAACRHRGAPSGELHANRRFYRCRLLKALRRRCARTGTCRSRCQHATALRAGRWHRCCRQRFAACALPACRYRRRAPRCGPALSDLSSSCLSVPVGFACAQLPSGRCGRCMKEYVLPLHHTNACPYSRACLNSATPLPYSGGRLLLPALEDAASL